MKTYLIAYGATAVIFLILDALWLTTMASLLYRPILGDMMLASPRLAAAAAFYIIYMFGICYFAVAPALQNGQWTSALVNGAILGLVAYATYDLTNEATLRVWSTTITLADIAWGTLVTAAAATLAFFVTRYVTQG